MLTQQISYKNSLGEYINPAIYKYYTIVKIKNPSY